MAVISGPHTDARRRSQAEGFSEGVWWLRRGRAGLDPGHDFASESTRDFRLFRCQNNTQSLCIALSVCRRISGYGKAAWRKADFGQSTDVAYSFATAFSFAADDRSIMLSAATAAALT